VPELPEVETVVRGLQTALPGRRILEVRLGKTDFIVDPAALERDLPGRTITAVQRHGKFIVLDLESSNEADPQFTFLIHLGMTGQIVTCSPEIPIPAHTHVFLALDNGKELRYTDVRRFGSMQIVVSREREAVLGKLGLDALAATREEFSAAIRSRRARIKALLLDQSILRGMGNIYTDESLWRARIHPMRLGSSLKNVEVEKLHRSVREILTEAIRLRGSSVSNYVDSEGCAGGFQLRHRVYQREGEKCVRCKTVIRRAIVAGRSSYFCPGCQKPPRQKSSLRKSSRKRSRKI